jgi:hypothetical protein
MKKCEQNCGKLAEVYGGGPKSGDWAGNYCLECCKALGFTVWDILRPTLTHPLGTIIEKGDNK